VTTLPDRPNTALLVVDVQRGVVENAHERDQVIANIGTLVEQARRGGAPVVWVQHADDHVVSAAPSTAPSSLATTPPSSATPTPPRT
jgi:nicotinamidase-related amidase